MITNRRSLDPAPQTGARTRGLRQAMIAIALLASEVPAGAATQAGPACPLCRDDLRVPVVPMTAAWLDSVAHDHAVFNQEKLAAIDSLLRSGTYGRPDDPAAIESAHLAARLSTINAYRDLVALACDTTCIHEADESALRALYSRYADVNLFIPARMISVRMGLGRVCIRYDLEQFTAGTTRLGGKQLRWRVADVKIRGHERRVLDVVFPTGMDDEVRLMFERHHTFAVEYRRSPGPPAPFEWFIVSDLEGGWIRKWGTHRPTGYMFWVSEPTALSAAEPQYALASAAGGWSPNRKASSTALVGLRLYVPGLKLKMPLLPDINVDDLREVELPMPILPLDYLRNGQQPSWLHLNQNLGFKKWQQNGDIPPEIRRRFPDS